MYFKEMPSSFEAIKQDFVISDPVLHSLASEGLKSIPFKSRQDKPIYEDDNGNKFIVKPCSKSEVLIYTKVFPSIRNSQQPFSTLLLPEYRNVIASNDGNLESKDLVVINYYEGKTFNDSWDEITPEGYGGRGIDLDMSEKIVNLLSDFATIDITKLEKFDLSTFNFADWKNLNFPFITEILQARNLINSDQADKAFSILSNPDLFKTSKLILTNGDFYPRNLIELRDGKIAVVDWEGRQDYKDTKYNLQNTVDQRTVFINYLENNIAFFFVHMWGNYSFQKTFLKDSADRFKLTPENLQASILIKSLEQALIWPDDLSRRQIEIFVNALDINYIKDLIADLF